VDKKWYTEREREIDRERHREREKEREREIERKETEDTPPHDLSPTLSAVCSLDTSTECLVKPAD
jgi:F0F1-type ATP synthase epsilon subunit